jgi:hypothetical protein
MRHPSLLISLILCFSSGLNFGLASDVGFGHIACPPNGKNLDSTNLASNQIWVSLLFNTAKNTGEGSGFVESDGTTEAVVNNKYGISLPLSGSKAFLASRTKLANTVQVSVGQLFN